MTLLREVVTVARLDLAEVRRSRWMLLAGAVYTLLAVAFVGQGMRESGVLGFTGAGRVLLSLCHALILVLPLLGLSATCQVVNRARDDGTLELLFSQPLSRAGYLLGVTVTRYLALVAPLLALLALLGIAGATFAGAEGGGSVPADFAPRAAAVSASLLWACVGVGVALSTAVRNQSKAGVYALLAWAAGVALLDFALLGVMLQWRLNPRAVFALAAINPVQSARLGLLSGVEPELGTLGPVGFYLATRLGPRWLFALGVGWPAAVGTLGLWSALRTFRRGDAV